MRSSNNSRVEQAVIGAVFTSRVPGPSRVSWGEPVLNQSSAVLNRSSESRLLMESDGLSRVLFVQVRTLEPLEGPGCGGESACTPDSVPGFPGDGHPSRPAVARRALAAYPRGNERATLPLLGLAPGGVCRAAGVTPGAGALLPHRFTLTCATPYRSTASPSAVCSLWHFPAGRPDWVLPSTLPCGVRTFLGRVPGGPGRGHPADSPPPPFWPVDGLPGIAQPGRAVGRLCAERGKRRTTAAPHGEGVPEW